MEKDDLLGQQAIFQPQGTPSAIQHQGLTVLTFPRPLRESSGPHFTGQEPQARKARVVTDARKQGPTRKVRAQAPKWMSLSPGCPCGGQARWPWKDSPECERLANPKWATCPDWTGAPDIWRKRSSVPAGWLCATQSALWSPVPCRLPGGLRGWAEDPTEPPAPPLTPAAPPLIQTGLWAKHIADIFRWLWINQLTPCCTSSK